MDARIKEAAAVIQRGGTVVFPTETVYGLGANALDAKAVSRIFEIKGRPRFNPLIVHLPSLSALGDMVSEIPPQAQALAKAFWPGPLTLVLPKQDSVPSLVTAGLSTVAVRMPLHEMARRLLEEAGVPIAAPSANRFSRLSPTRVEHAWAQLGAEVDFYLDGGPCPIGVESTIIGWVEGRPTLLRMGGLAAQEIEAVTGPLATLAPGSRPLAPGSLARHYSPRTPLLFSDKPVVFGENRRVALLALRPTEESTVGYSTVIYLSEKGDLQEAAAALFARLNEMELLKFDLIVARPVPDHGLGAAINDRLRRAGQDRAAQA